MLDPLEKSKLYLGNAERILTRDFRAAYKDKDWNIAVRRAQESVELAMKAVFYLCGQTPPNDHNVNVFPLLRREASFRDVLALMCDPASGGPLYILRRDEQNNAVSLLRIVAGTWTELAAFSVGSNGDEQYGISGQKGGVQVVRRGKTVLSTTASISTLRRREGVSVGGMNERALRKAVTVLAKGRNRAFYFEEILTKTAADSAGEVTRRVVDLVKGYMQLLLQGREFRGEGLNC